MAGRLNQNPNQPREWSLAQSGPGRISPANRRRCDQLTIRHRICGANQVQGAGSLEGKGRAANRAGQFDNMILRRRQSGRKSIGPKCRRVNRAMHHHHGRGGDHGHGVVDPSIATTDRGIWAIKWSFIGLAITAAIQVAVVVLSGSVALFADTIHNVGDALTAVPLWIAFRFARLPPSRRFNYGFGRVEDLAGAAIVLVIIVSAATALYQSIDRLINPREVEFLWAVGAAGAIGFIGNEVVALFRIRVGREINSAALIADGNHARIDGFTSLAVLAGALAIWAGFPIADPIAGLIITAVIAKIVYDSVKSVFGRMLDGVDPALLGELEHLAGHVDGVVTVVDSRARWIGHRLHAEIRVNPDGNPSLADVHQLELRVAAALSDAIPYLGEIVVRVQPSDA